MVELIRLGATNHVAISRTMGSSVMTARLALASGYQSLLRRKKDEECENRIEHTRREECGFCISVGTE